MKKTNKLISILLVLAMLLSMVPIAVFTASAASAPSYSTTSEGVRLYANGTNLFIEAGSTSGTAVYYMNGSTKTYVNPNGAKGNDLSNSEIYLGTASSNSDYFDVSLVMTGGEVGTIYTAKSYGYLIGKVTVAVTGTAKAGLIWCGSESGPYNGQDHHGKNGNLAIFNTVGAEVRSGSTGFDGMIKYTESGWEISGNAVIPEGVTMIVASGQTVTVPVNAAVENNGALVNNGTLELYGAVTGNSITGNGTINCYADYIENVSTVSSVSAKINGASVTLANGQYRLSGGKLYIWLPEGDAEVTLNSTKYYGIIVKNSPKELTAEYSGVTDISGIPSDITAYVAQALEPKTNTTTFVPEFTYEVLASGTTAAEAKMTGTSLYASGAGTIKLKITASDAYTSYSETFTVTVNDAGYAADIANGDITISKYSDTQLKITHAGFDGGSLIINNDEHLMITGTSGTDKNYGIVVENGATANILLKDCSINRNGYNQPVMRFSSGASVNLQLAGENVFTNSNSSHAGDEISNAGIHVPSGATLVIDGEGSLAVTGGEKSAGIGGGTYEVSAGTITINGGTVTATGDQAAGIGGSYKGAGGTVTINGGTVTANGATGSAGIGSGDNGAGGTVTISGGTVTATGGSHGAGIGGGYSGAGGTVTISGGIVTATGNGNGAGIGGGKTGAGATVTISGGNVTATGIDGAGIGGGGCGYASHGAAGDGGTVTISGGTVTATSVCGAGIGGGGVDYTYYKYDATAGAGGTVTISGGTVVAQSTGSYGGAGIGGGGSTYGTGNSGGTVVITGGNIKATSNGGEAIGKGYNGTDSGTLKNADGNNLTLNTITLNGAAADTAVTKVEGINYGLTDVKTLDTDKLYFYLPADTVATSISAGGTEYICHNSNLNYYAGHDWSNKDGICANGCGLTCDHTGQTGATCEICGAVLHTHSFTYSASGDTITAVCENTDGNCPDSEGTLTILAPADLYADGTTAKEATVEHNLVDTSVAVSDITYSTADGSAPTTAGTYTASVTVGGATASVQFELIKRSAIAENFVYTAPENLVYDGTAKYATVEVFPEITGMGEITVTYYKDGEAVEPVNAGTYTVKVSTADSDKYYAINNVELASFTIAAKDISDGFIILGDALTYNGKEQTQTVEKVLPTGTAPEATYTVSGNKATNVGVYLLTVTGTGNFMGEAKIAFEIAVDMNGVDFDKLHPLNVKATDKEKIEYIYNQLDNAFRDYADAEKRNEWDNNKSYCVELLKMIESVKNHIESFKNKLAEYDIDTVTSDDSDDLESFYNDEVSYLYDNYFDNLTEEQTKELDDILSGISALQKRIGDVAKEITRITNAVNGYDEATVTSADKADIEKLLADIKALTDGDNITDTEREQLNGNEATLKALLDKIGATADKIARIETAVNGYDEESVKSTDKADLEQLVEDIKALTDKTNITEDEITKLGELDAKIDALIKKIDDTAAEIERIDEAVNGYDKETVTSDDVPELGKLIEDIKALTDGDNLTEDEKAALEEADKAIDELVEKLTEVAEEIKRVDEAVKSYDENTVKSTDSEDLAQLKDDVQALIDSTNTTENEKTALGEMIKDIEALEERIEETENQLEEIGNTENSYNPETVTSDDKAAIEEKLAEIEEVNPDNLTDEQKAEYEEIKSGFEALLEKIEAAGAQVEAIGAELEMFEEERVTIFHEDEIEALKAKIDELLADENMGEAETAKLEEYKAECDNLIEIINTPKAYFSMRLFYFVWDALHWLSSHIVFIFNWIF